MSNPLVTSADVPSHVAEFVGDDQYFFFAPVSRGWKNAWGERPRATRAVTVDTSVNQLVCAFESGLRRRIAAGPSNLCFAIAKLGRLDLVQVLRERDCPWDEDVCTQAAEFNHLAFL